MQLFALAPTEKQLRGRGIPALTSKCWDWVVGQARLQNTMQESLQSCTVHLVLPNSECVQYRSHPKLRPDFGEQTLGFNDQGGILVPYF